MRKIAAILALAMRHGFGIGTGTVAEGWLDNAVKFREKQF